MSNNVLIASLGDHPAVVTGMVKKLKYQENLTINEVILFHTQGSGKLITLGVDLITETLQKTCQVSPEPLSFTKEIADPNTQADSIAFLRRLADVLEDREFRGDNIYLSLAGGRKNMSALMAVICQFFPAVQGLFHLITQSNRAFPTIETLFEMPEVNRLKLMKPAVEQMTLIKIPFHPFSNAIELRRYFAAQAHHKDYSIDTSGLAEAFFGAIWQPQGELPQQVYLAQTAIDEYESLRGTPHQEVFDNYLRDMRKPAWLKTHIHPLENFSTDCICLKKGGRGAGSIKERPFIYQQGNKVIVCRMTLHGSTYEQLLAQGQLYKKDHPPVKSLAELYRGEAVLVVPLGEAPMVATQTYTLLQMPIDGQKRLKVSEVAVIYPAQNGLIKQGVKLLQRAFRQEGIPFQALPIAGIDDVDTDEKCEIYLKSLLKAIEDLRQANPDKQIALSLSGGRKGMSALTLFAAQRADIEQVYHTTITDPDFEQQLLDETETSKLKKLNRDEQVKMLFLKNYDMQMFTIFPIPVIPLA